MFWGVTLESGKRYSQIVESSYHLSMASLEPCSKEDEKPNKYVSVMIEHGKTEFLLCTLEYGRVMQVALDLLFVEGEEVSFFLNGEGTVHLTGYVTDNEDQSLILSEQSDEESAVSDTEDNNYKKLLNMDDEGESTDEEWTPKKASKEKKKLLKASTVPKVKSIKDRKVPEENVLADSTDKAKLLEVAAKKEKLSSVKEEKKDEEDDTSSDESDEEMDDLDEDEESNDDDDEEEDSDEEDEDEEEDKSDDDDKEEELPSPSKKKKSIANDKDHTPAKSFLQAEQKKGSNKTVPHKEMSRVSGSTPNIHSNKSVDSKKKPDIVSNKEKPETPFRNKSEGSRAETPSSKKSDSTKTVNEDVTLSHSKKKKKKRSLNENQSSTEEKSFTQTPKQDASSTKLQGGVKVTDIKQGHGPQAKKGRFVHICYIGRLNSGVEFDSSMDRPFSFRLGRGEVIKGLDAGIEGMKVGGKRKLVVPPTQGYGNKKVGPIPPNSTLQFEVELKAVS